MTRSSQSSARVEGSQHVSGCIDRHAISKTAAIVKVSRKMGHSHESFAEHLVPDRGARASYGRATEVGMSRGNPTSVSVERADGVHASVGGVPFAGRRWRDTPRAPSGSASQGEGVVAVERTVLVVEDDGLAVLGALGNAPPAIVKPVLDVDTDDQVRIAAAMGPAAPA